MRSLHVWLLAGLALSGCASMAQEDAPALIIQPSSDTHAELVRVVSAALSSSEVRIASDALTRDDLLIIDRTPARDAAGQRISGRDYGRPHHFRLLKQGSKCVLLHAETGIRHQLDNVQCVLKS